MIDSQLRLFCEKKLAGWMGGWMEGRKGGWKSRVKDCLQQSKTIFKRKVYRLITERTATLNGRLEKETGAKIRRLAQKIP